MVDLLVKCSATRRHGGIMSPTCMHKGDRCSSFPHRIAFPEIELTWKLFGSVVTYHLDCRSFNATS